MMKKMVIFMLCILITAGFTGCKGKKADTEGGAPEEAATGAGTAVEQASPLGDLPIKGPGQQVDFNKVSSVTVNGELIDQERIDQEVKQFAIQLQMRIPTKQLEMMKPMMRGKSVESLISRVLLLQQADKEGLQIKPEQVQAKFEEVRATFPSPETFDQHLKDLGFSGEDLKKQLEIQLKAEMILDRHLGDDIKVTDKDIDDYYKQNARSFNKTDRLRVGEIMIKVDPKDSEEVRASKREKAEKILKELDGGADFGVLAAEHSESRSKERAGELGVIEPGRTEKPFEEAAYSLQEGEYSRVVETQRGYHIIKAIERLEPISIQLSEVKDGIRTLLETLKKQKATMDYVNKLKEKATITYGPPKGA